MRMLPPASRSPPFARSEGSDGTNASSTAATRASTTLTHTRLTSTVISSARNENRAGVLREHANERPGQRGAKEGSGAAQQEALGQQRQPSAPASAPSAARSVSSDSRRTVRARMRLATFEQAITKISIDAPSSTIRTA